ncbi:hypothetical protein [Lichenibacterium dinghuense]|uniref:hypothetical protein n=1 Tax=Lichenibacterium dinghuense TaxID=2895977 RepID=UPI001F2805E8|nr:hypothetical protein [Lichenibacterium sp. 6Y81]
MKLNTTPRRPWTAEDDARLAELKVQGLYDSEVAAELGRTTEAVTSHRQWLRGHAAKVAPVPDAPPHEEDEDSRSGRAWTPEEDDRLAAMRSRGVPEVEIAAKLGRTVGAMQGHVYRIRMQGDTTIASGKRASPWTPERVAEARAMRAEGLTPSQIAVRLGSNAVSVGRALRSPETTEDSPGEGVRVGRMVPDHNRTAAAVEEARAALARAEARHREAIDPILATVREAIVRAGFVDGPDGDDGDGVWPSPEWLVLDHLRRQGLELRRVA